MLLNNEPSVTTLEYDYVQMFSSTVALKQLRWTSAAISVLLATFLLYRELPSEALHHGTNEHRNHINIRSPRSAASSNFHLLIPATSSNGDLCKLQLSITALTYPTPVFINWAASDNESHLTKLTGLLRYINSLPPAADTDLVLIIDGYDIWFQLRPDVMLARYFSVIAAANKRLEARLGKDTMRKHNIHQSILFGPDKICWPEDPRRTACWAVPNSTLPEYAFGPETDSGRFRDQYRPRWLNSGTIIGPVNDLRALLSATVDRIKADYTTDSDQWYLSELFGEQEYARMLLAEGPLASRKRRTWMTEGWFGEGHYEDVILAVPEGNTGEKEYHVAIDYKSELFQTMSYTTQFLSWRRYDEDADGDLSPAGILPYDIAASLPPFPQHLPHGDDALEQLRNQSWRSIPLGTNAISNTVFPLLHVTGEKHYRETWWDRMWFTPHGESLIKSASLQPVVPLWIDGLGREWRGYTPFANSSSSPASSLSAATPPPDPPPHVTAPIPPTSRLPPPSEQEQIIPPNPYAGGGYSDKGIFLTWAELCGAHEDAVFRGVVGKQATPHNVIQKGELKGVEELGLAYRPPVTVVAGGVIG